MPPLAESLVEHINTFLRDYTTQWAAADPDLQPQVSGGGGRLDDLLLLWWWCPWWFVGGGSSSSSSSRVITTNRPSLRQSSLSRQSKVIRQICQRLMEVCNNDNDDLDRDTTRQVVQVVTALGHAFTKLVDLMLSREIKVRLSKKVTVTVWLHFHSYLSLVTRQSK